MNAKKRQANLDRRRGRIRGRLFGTAERPRMAVSKTNRYLYVQIVDDAAGKILLARTTLNKGQSQSGKAAKSVEWAKKLGTLVAEEAMKQGISKVVFDRGTTVFHGRIKAVAEAARAKGLKF
jgi:large subunit ribosomal protein L18